MLVLAWFYYKDIDPSSVWDTFKEDFSRFVNQISKLLGMIVVRPFVYIFSVLVVQGFPSSPSKGRYASYPVDRRLMMNFDTQVIGWTHGELCVVCLSS